MPLFDVLAQLSIQSPWLVAWQLIANGGWVVLVIFFYFATRIIWLNWRQNKWHSQQQFVLLAIDIPEESEKSMQSIEQMFANLWGSYTSVNFVDKWWRGKFQLPYAVEIVSLEGYIQFLFWTPVAFRDLAEAAIYAQYPGAEIMAVDDYTKSVPHSFPTEGWDLWGTEMKLVKNFVYPIKTYPAFEHSLTQTFADPLGAVLEALANLGPGEQVWLQLVITPIPDAWQGAGKKEIMKLRGVKVENKGPLDFLLKPFRILFRESVNVIGEGLGKDSSIFAASQVEPASMYNLNPGEAEAIKAIQAKSSKVGYQTKMRYVYVSRKEQMNKAKAIGGVLGALRQYSELNLNGFRPHSRTMTSASYFRVKQRVTKRINNLLRGYRRRSQIAGGGKGFVFNIEELASVWHFPDITVKAPRVKRAVGRRTEPPVELPVEEMGFFEPYVSAADVAALPESEKLTSTPADQPPGNLPVA